MTKSWIAAAALTLALAASGAEAAPGGGGGMSGGGSSGVDAPRGQDPAKAYEEGLAALRAQNFREAASKLRIAADAAPNAPQVQYHYGLALVGAGDHRRARRPFEKAVRGADAVVEAHTQLGLVYLQLAEPAKAQEQLAALASVLAACVAPTCDDARRQRLQALHDRLKQAIDAGAAPAPATTGWILPGPAEGRAAYAEGVGLANQARYAEARGAFQRAQGALGQPHADVLNYLGFTTRKLGEYAEAERFYAAALAIDPDHRGATEYLGELYLEMGRLSDARTQLAKLDALCPYGCAEREELSRWIAAGR